MLTGARRGGRRYLDHWSCPWLDGLTINHDFTMEDYTAATSGNGVQKTIFLETAAATEDLDKEDAYILDLCANPTTLVSAAVFGCDMEAPDFKERVTRLAASEYVKGIRQVFYVRYPLPSTAQFSPSSER